MSTNTRFPQVIVGLWPIAGITSGPTDPDENQATIRSALDSGARWFDTAYSYGFEGESDRLLGRVIADTHQRLHVIGKAGQRWNSDRQRVVDASPETLTRDVGESLERMGIERFDLLMLHDVDPAIPIERSAETLVTLMERGWADALGVCNVDLALLKRFASVHRPAAIQAPLNLFQRATLDELAPWCHEHKIAVHVFWTLMKGILAGAIGRDHAFAQGDSRARYDIYQGTARERAHQLVDRLAGLAAETDTTVARLSIGWTLSQPGITSAIVGAKHPWQIEDTAGSQSLAPEVVERIDQWVAESGL